MPQGGGMYQHAKGGGNNQIALNLNGNDQKSLFSNFIRDYK